MTHSTDISLGQRALVNRPAAPKGGISDSIIGAAKQAKVGPFRQFAEIARLQLKRVGITAKEYYALQVYRPDLSRDEKAAFLGEIGTFQLNLRLAPPMLTQLRGFLSDKVAFTALLARLGLPTTTTQAVYSTDRALGEMPVLRDAAAIEAFLTGAARYPLFGKPVSSIQGIGAVGIASVDGTRGIAHLASGRSLALAELAREIASAHPAGFVFQDAVAQHPAMTALIGTAVGTLRVVTVIDTDRPRPLYAVWKIPAPKASADNFWQAGSMITLPDQATGEVTQARRGRGLATEWLDKHPVSQRPFTGFRIPHWQAALDLAVQAHGIFPVNGILGWDIAITEAGPLVIECNDSPAHALYQLASGRGVMNPEFRPIFDRVLARNARLLDERKAHNRRLEAGA